MNKLLNLKEVQPFCTSLIKIPLIMRITLILLFVFAFNINAEYSYSQSAKISLNIKNSSVEKVLQTIEEKSDFYFLYSNRLIDVDRTVSVNVENEAISSILNHLFTSEDVEYEVKGKQIVLSPKEETEISTTLLAVEQQQKKTITGNIVDAQGEPIIGANVIEKGTSNGTVTDFEGNFTLGITDNAILRVSYIGYLEQEIATQGKYSINIKLEEDTKTLDELVVVGYGTMKKRDLVGAVEQISGDVLDSQNNMNAVRSLQGQIAGVEVGLYDGKPNRATIPVIRGTTWGNGKRNTNSIGAGGSALVLIDGAEGDLSYVNPSDIESISVLKDASSAAVYGARGAFGVILVTTKNAKSGAAKVIYDGKFTVARRTVTPERVTNGYQWTQMFLKSWQLYNQKTTYPTGIDNVFVFSEDWFKELAVRDADPSLPQVRTNKNGRYEYFGNTDWYELFYKDNTLSHEHNVTVSGRDEKTSYFVSGRLYHNNGRYRPFDEQYKQYNIRAKGSIKINSKLLLENNTVLAQQNNIEPMVQYGDLLIPRMISRQGYPVTVPRNPDGTWTEAATYIGYAAAVEGSSFQDVNNFDARNTTTLTYTPIKDKLIFKADFTWSQTHRERVRAAGLYDFSNGPALHGKKSVYSYLKKWNWEEEYISSNIVGTYIPELGDKHHLTFMGGWNIEDKYYRSQYTERRGLLYNTKPSFTLMDGDFYQTNDGGYEWGVVGYFARANYKFKDRYLLEVSGRYDGSSKFPLNQQWGFFPSSSLGWIVSDESFMSITRDVIDNLKFRASFGSLGNGAVSPYQFISSMSIGNTVYLINGQRQSYTEAPALIPTDLTWETANMYNIGIDLAMFDQRFNFSFDAYRKLTDNMYTVGPTLPDVVGATAPKGNNASMKTDGWELSIGWRDQFTLGGKPFNWSVKGTLWDSQSWITKYYNTTGDIRFGTFYEGQRLGDLWGFKVAGLFKDREEIDNWANQSFFTLVNGSQADNNNHILPGDLKFHDLNDDGRIDYGDRTLDNHGDLEVIGNAAPRYQFGLNLSANWSNFGASVFFQGIGRKHWYPGNESGLFWGQYGRSYEMALQVHTEDVYDEETQNIDAYWPLYRGYQASRALGTMSQTNDRFLQNVAYVRLKNITIDYTLPKTLVEKAKIENVKIYLSGENLFTWSPLYKVTPNFDPENINSGDTDFQATYGSDAAGDGYGYPVMKNMTVGLSIIF